MGLTTLPFSRTECLEIWEPQPRGTLMACLDLRRDCSVLDISYSHGSTC